MVPTKKEKMGCASYYYMFSYFRYFIDSLREEKEMAYITFNFKSGYLEGATTVGVILPGYNGIKDRQMEISERFKECKKLKTLYLLHGAYDDYNSWMRGSRIEEYAEENNVAVIMPDAATSYYTDMVYVKNYYSYISDDLPAVM